MLPMSIERAKEIIKNSSHPMTPSELALFKAALKMVTAEIWVIPQVDEEEV